LQLESKTLSSFGFYSKLCVSKSFGLVQFNFFKSGFEKLKVLVGDGSWMGGIKEIDGVKALGNLL
jgi:hypothetical protein